VSVRAISSIAVRTRHRKDMGAVADLAASIREIGLSRPFCPRVTMARRMAPPASSGSEKRRRRRGRTPRTRGRGSERFQHPCRPRQKPLGLLARPAPSPRYWRAPLVRNRQVALFRNRAARKTAPSSILTSIIRQVQSREGAKLERPPPSEDPQMLAAVAQSIQFRRQCLECDGLLAALKTPGAAKQKFPGPLPRSNALATRHWSCSTSARSWLVRCSTGQLPASAPAAILTEAHAAETAPTADTEDCLSRAPAH
jgi:hypothetical protein